MIDLQQILGEDSRRAGTAHARFLDARQKGLEQLSSLVAAQISTLRPPGTPPDPIFESKPAPLFDWNHLQEFATGSVTNCFGPEFERYAGRRFPRVPNGELALISRVVDIGGEKGKFDLTASIDSEYDLPQNPWFTDENNYPEIPYSIYMEIALQPCGFLSAYLGSPMIFPDQDLFFRNLDGQGQLRARIDGRGKTIHTRAVLSSTLVSGGTIIQRFQFELTCEGRLIFTGNSTFGYFSPEAMLKQAGLDGGKRTQPEGNPSGGSEGRSPAIDLARMSSSIGQPMEKPARPHYRLPAGRLSLIDEVFAAKNGGRHQQGYVYARKKIDPKDWFYRCHFFQDPVMPGSLGVEAVLQSLQAYALHFDLGKTFRSPRFGVPTGADLAWRYRGQIVPPNRWMQLETHLTRIEERAGWLILEGDASLWADDLRIYEVKGAIIGLTESV